MALPVISVPNAAGVPTNVNIPNSGRHDAVDSAAIALSNEDKADLAAIRASGESITPVGVNIGTSGIDNNGTTLTPKFAKIAVSGAGVNALIAAVATKKIRVLAYNLISNGAVNAKFQSHVTPTDLTGLKYMPAAGNGICANFNPLGWFETLVGEALDINLSAAVAVGGELVYIEV